MMASLVTRWIWTTALWAQAVAPPPKPFTPKPAPEQPPRNREIDATVAGGGENSPPPSGKSLDGCAQLLHTNNRHDGPD
jgi:hypothetical protein